MVILIFLDLITNGNICLYSDEVDDVEYANGGIVIIKDTDGNAYVTKKLNRYNS